MVVVDNCQYYQAMKQLKGYQVHRQQNGLPQIHVVENLEKGLLTGAYR